MEAPQVRQRPRSATQLRIGTSSIGRRKVSQLGQCDPGDTTDSPRGTRHSTTLRNDPIRAPKTKADHDHEGVELHGRSMTTKRGGVVKSELLEADVGSVASVGWDSGSDAMPVRKRAVKPPEPRSTRPRSTSRHQSKQKKRPLGRRVRRMRPTGWAVCSSSRAASPSSSSTTRSRSRANRVVRLGEILISDGVLREAALARGLAQQLDLPLIDLRLRTPHPDALARLPEALVRKHRALPDGDRRGPALRRHRRSRSPTPRSPRSVPRPT